MNFSNTKDMMNISMSELAVLLSAFGVLVAALSLLFTVTSFRKQLQLNFFADYTKRYQEILLNFPGSINEADFDIENFSPESRDKILRYMRAYFDLCSEEYYLWKQGNLDDKTWREWETGIKFAFSKPAFSQAWSMLQLDTIYYGAFSYYVMTQRKAAHAKVASEDGAKHDARTGYQALDSKTQSGADQADLSGPDHRT